MSKKKSEVSEFGGMSGFEDQVDESLFEEERKQYIGLTWHGQPVEGRPGYWACDVESLKPVLENEEPDASGYIGPAGFWKVQELRFGRDPNAAPVLCYVTRRLRCVPIGVRRRAIVTSDVDGRDYFFPPFTRKDQRFDAFGSVVSGKFTSHVQVMVLIENVAEPVIIGLRGMSKTMSWDNDPTDKRWGNSDFAYGVYQQIGQYSKRAADANKLKKVPPKLCTWIVDLVPAYQHNGEPYFVLVSKQHETYVNPFTLDMTTGKKDMPATRYVGHDRFRQLQELRGLMVKEWEEEWQDAEAMAKESQEHGAASDNGHHSEEAIGAQEDDIEEIPF